MTLNWIGCGLTSVGVHCYAMARAAAAAAARLDMTLHIYAPRSAARKRLDLPGLRPVLARSVYQTDFAAFREPTAFEQELRTRRDTFRQDLHASLDGATSRADVVVPVTPMAPELAGFADWLESLAPQFRPRLGAYCVLPIAYGLATDAAWQRERMTALYRESLHRLMSLTDGAFLLACESQQVLRDLSPFAPNALLQPHIFEIPSAPQSVVQRNADYVLVIGSLYRSRTDKGIGLVLEMLRSTAAHQSPFDWVVQVAPMFRQSPRGCDSKNIRFLLEVPDHESYWNWLTGASLILLPYDPAAYGDGRGSGIFEEALAAGVPMICSTAPFFVEKLTALGYPELIFEPYTASALLRKTIEVMGAIGRYRAAFAETATRLRRSDSAAQFLLSMAGRSQNYEST